MSTVILNLISDLVTVLVSLVGLGIVSVATVILNTLWVVASLLLFTY